MDETNLLLAGPSNAGLADPGHSTAISLTHVSVALAGLPEMIGTRCAEKPVASRVNVLFGREGSCYYSEPEERRS
jgi:hypothetical protein